MKINLRKNTAWGATEVILSGVSLFLLYKYIILFIGVKGLGLWSLVLSTTSLARLADIGAAAGLTRFVALGSAEGFGDDTASYIDTAYFLTFVMYAVVGALLFVPLWYGLASVVPAENLADAHALLPFAIASLVLLNLNGVTLSGIMGVQRADIKSKIVIGGLVVQIAFVIFTIRDYGLLSLAWGQMLQYGMVTVVGRFVLMRLTPGANLGIIPHRVSRAAMKDLFSFGMKLQATSLVAFVFEPFVKLILSSTAGLEALGLFEMASRIVIQVRHIAYVPMQSLVSAFVHVRKTEVAIFQSYYNKVFSNAVAASSMLMVGTFILSPLFSFLWLGKLDRQFITIMGIVCSARLVHLIATPAYMVGVSEGKIVNNLIGHVITSIVFPAVAYVAFKAVPSMYVVIGVCMLGMAVGEGVAFLLNSKQFNLPRKPSAKSVKEELAVNLRQILRKLGL
jgi:O-antigen/teichoic acid export membrane protein